MLPSRIGSAPSGNGSVSNRSTDRDAVGMLGANGPGGPRGARAGVTPLQTAVQGNTMGLSTGVVLAHGARFDPDRESAPLCSASDNDSDSGEEDDPVASLGYSRRGVKREREMEATVSGQEVGVPPGGYGMVPGGVVGAKPGKKTRGRVKIKMEFIDNKLRRYTTFSKRKTGIMKKAYELSTLTGTQVLLLVASETGHVYTFATRKLQPMITSETGKALIQTCLNSPDSPPRTDPSMDQRMSATGFEETDLTYQVSESESMGDTKDSLKPTFTVAGLPGPASSAPPTVPTTSTTMQVSSGPSFPITNYLAPVLTGGNVGANGTVLKSAGTSAGVMQLPGSFTFMPGTWASSAPWVEGHPISALVLSPTFPPSLPPPTCLAHSSSARWIDTPSLADGFNIPTPLGNRQASRSPPVALRALATPGLGGSLGVGNTRITMHGRLQLGNMRKTLRFQVTTVIIGVFCNDKKTIKEPIGKLAAQSQRQMVIGQQSSGSSSNLTELQVVNLDAVAQSLKSD
uniref:Serum response factor n=1 Tax=Tetraodon nigroviridis TaxID=99883 RepID=H3D7C3_TETNG